MFRVIWDRFRIMCATLHAVVQMAAELCNMEAVASVRRCNNVVRAGFPPHFCAMCRLFWYPLEVNMSQ